MSRNNPILEYLLAAVMLGLLILCMVGCKTTAPAIPTSHERDSVRTEYVHDSVYIDRWHTEYQRGDTVFVRDSIWRDRWHNKHDSIYISNTDTITVIQEVVKPASAFWKGSGIAFWILLGLVVLGIVVGIIIKIAK